MSRIYDEESFEDAIEAHLCEHGDYERLPSARFDATFWRIIADWLLARGCEVINICDADRTDEYELTCFRDRWVCHLPG